MCEFHYDGDAFMSYAGKIQPWVNHFAGNMKLSNHTKVSHMISKIAMHMQ
jgi:hypothetical protein